MRPNLSIALLALVSCLVPEQGIDNTRVVGTLYIGPTQVEETGEGNNGVPFQPVDMDPLHFGYREWSGTLVDSADVDHWKLITPVARGADNPLSVDITLADQTQTAKIAILNLDDVSLLGVPAVVSSEEFTGWTLHSFEAEAGVFYAVAISTGSVDGLDYSCFAMGQHPDQANILVGAYSGTKANDRGNLYGGSNAKPWVEVPGHGFESWYEMLYIREFLSQGDDKLKEPDESVTSAYVWAGTWSNLSQGLPAGTWHSRTPIAVNFKKTGKPQHPGTPPGAANTGDTGTEAPGEPLIRDVPAYPTVEVAEPVVINRIAPVAIGQTWPEVEPNDTDIVDTFSDPSQAQDLGTLTGVGYVDVITGGTLISDGYDYWGADNDTFKFQVPVPTFLNFKLSWADPALDLDVILVDATGKVLDLGYYGFPEIPETGTEILQPGQDYYLGVLLYVGPGVAGQAVPYDLTLEQIPE